MKKCFGGVYECCECGFIYVKVQPGENKKRLNDFLTELDKLLKKHHVTLYATRYDDLDIGVGAYSERCFDTDLISKNYGGVIQ